MWKQPRGYIEGWIISGGILITGLFLQFFLGKVIPEAFRFPANLISGAVFLLLLLLFHLISKKIKELQWFSGYSAAITSFSMLLLPVIIMGLTRQSAASVDLSHEPGFVRVGFMQMTVSWPFILLYLYFLWILGLVILKRISRFTLKDTGFVLNHFGLFLTLFAAFWGSGDLERLRMTAPLDAPEWRATNEKNEMMELPLAIELKSFTIDEYPPKLMLLDNITGEAFPKKQPQNVSVETCPSSTQLMNWKLEIAKHLPSAAAVFNTDTLNYVASDMEGAMAAIYVKARNMNDNTEREGWVSCGSYLYPYSSLKLDDQVSLVMPEREPKHFTSDIRVYTKSGEIKDAIVEVNHPVSIADWKIYQLSYDERMGKWSRHSVFELVKDPWLPAVYTGMFIMITGSLFLFFSAPEKTA